MLEKSLNIITFNAIWLIAIGFGFTLLSHLWPAIKQPYLRKDMKADTLYWLLAPVLYSLVFKMLIAFYAGFVVLNQMYGWGRQTLGTLPILLQAFLILLISDIVQYWLHRLFHRDPLWKYHAIHHSPQIVDWLTSARFHPVNIIMYSTTVNAFVAIMGFSTEAFLLLQPFNIIYSPLVHANVPWTYGPFKYVLASPVFHRWHHTDVNEGGNKNFAPTFSFLDVMFGTFYMPEGKQPENFGIHGNPVPDNILGQLAYPFRKKKHEGEPVIGDNATHPNT